MFRTISFSDYRTIFKAVQDRECEAKRSRPKFNMLYVSIPVYGGGMPTPLYFFADKPDTIFALRLDHEDSMIYLDGLLRIEHPVTCGTAIGNALEVAEAMAPDYTVAVSVFEPLAEAYMQHGFVIMARDEFDPAMAPFGWNEAVDGRPDVLTMHRFSTNIDLYDGEVL